MRVINPANILDWQDKYEWARGTVINNESQHYPERNEENMFINEDDDLVLRAIKEPTIIDGVRQEYSSAVAISKFDGKPGRGVLVRTGQTVSILAKLPPHVGAFGAFWLLRDDPVWQKTEIDIFETTAEVVNGKYHVAHHSHVNADKTYQKMAGSVDTGTDLVNEFNEYGAAVYEDRIDYLFNGEVVRSVALHDHEKGLDYYMLLNLAIAPPGHWAGGPEGSTYDWETNDMTVRFIVIEDNDELTTGAELPTDEEIDEALESIADKDDTQEGTTTLSTEKYEHLVNTMEVYQILLKDSDDEIEELLTAYKRSNPVARIFYSLGRAFGGKL